MELDFKFEENGICVASSRRIPIEKEWLVDPRVFKYQIARHFLGGLDSYIADELFKHYRMQIEKEDDEVSKING